MKFLTGFESFVGVNFWTCLFTLCNMVILYFFMRKLLFRPVKNMIDSRQKEIDDLYEDANRSKQDAAVLKERYEKCLSEADEAKDAILKDAYRKAQLRDEEMLRQAQEKAAQTLRIGKEACAQ